MINSQKKLMISAKKKLSSNLKLLGSLINCKNSIKYFRKNTINWKKIQVKPIKIIWLLKIKRAQKFWRNKRLFSICNYSWLKKNNLISVPLINYPMLFKNINKFISLTTAITTIIVNTITFMQLITLISITNTYTPTISKMNKPSISSKNK